MLKNALEKIGDKALGPKTEPATVIKEKKLANIKRKVYDKEEAEAEAKASTIYGRNCITLKAYAMAAADEVDDLKHGAIGVMRPLLQMMAADLDATQVTEATCIAQFENITGSLRHDDELTIKGEDPSDSLAIQQLDELEKAMKGEGDVHPIAQGKGTAIEVDCHGNRDQYDCAEMSKKKVGGQWMWVDGEAIGLGNTGGDVPIFKKIAVRQQALLKVARNMLKFGLHHHVIESTNRNHIEFTTKDGEIIKNWDGNF